MKYTMETAIHLEINTEKIQTSLFNEYTITKDFEKFTVLITKPSPRSRMGIKYVHHINFRNHAELSKRIFRMNEFVSKFIEKEEAYLKVKEAKKVALQNARTQFKNPYEVGQILYDSWGYDQTNIDFFQVTEIKGKTLLVRPISQTRTYTQQDCGNCMPVKDSFTGEAVKKVIQVRIYNEKINHCIKDCYVWHGTPLSWSSYH
jgi:nuclear transport factor 2 (NTF2) superfamily protein